MVGEKKPERNILKIAGQKLTSQRRRGRDLCDYVFTKKGALVAGRQLSGTGHAAKVLTGKHLLCSSCMLLGRTRF